MELRVALCFICIFLLTVENSHLLPSIRWTKIDSCRLVMLVLAALPVEPDTPAICRARINELYDKEGGNKNIYHHSRGSIVVQVVSIPPYHMIPEKHQNFVRCQIMDSTFTEYPDSPEVTPIAKDKKNKCMSDWERKYKKQLKKQKKMLKQFIKMQKRNERERQAAKEAEAAKVDEVKKNGFLSKLGDAFVKAVPAVLTAAVTAVIGIIFKRTRKKEDESQAMAKALQQAMKAVMA